MNGILGFTEILSTLIADDSQKAMTHHILTCAKRLLGTLNSIMTFAQLDSGYKLNLINVNLSALLESTVASIRALAKQKQLIVNCQIEQGVFIHSDEHLFQISFLNILDNAVKFTNQGEIDISLKKGTTPSEGIIITVHDTGIGIPAEKQEMIFEEFRQASEGYDRPYEGSGLGLSITRKSLHLLNCSLALESEVGHGSTFTLKIPASSMLPDSRKDNANKHTGFIPGHENQSESPLLLLVEDNDANIDLMKLYLKKDFRLDIAKDGLSAIELTGRNSYDCILMDINLGPGMDGGEAIQQIRQIPGYLTTPIIAVTGYTLQQEKEAILNKGADHYLAKPFNKNQLTDLLCVVFGTPSIVSE